MSNISPVFFWSQMMGTTKSYLDIGWIILVYPADLRLMFSFMNPSGNPQDANQPAAIFHWFSVGFCGDMCHDFTSYKPPFSSWFFSWISHDFPISFHIFPYFPMIFPYFPMIFPYFPMIFPYLPIFSHDFPSSTPVRMERKGAYYALVAAQESSEKADDAEDHQSLSYKYGVIDMDDIFLYH